MEQIKKISINETEYQIIDETALHEGDIPTNVSAFTNDAGYLTEHQSLDGLATEDYVQDQIATIPTPDVSGQINTHNQNTTAHSDIRTAIDELENAIDGIAIPKALSDLTADATHRLVTDTEKSTWNAKANASDIPSKTSDLTNDSGFATESYVNTQVSNLVNSAPDKLNTLDELAAALGDDANFANTVTTELSKKANSADLGSLAKKSTVDKSDLSSSVQTYLNKADSALQSYTETDPTVPSWAKASTKPSYTKNEVGLGNVDNVKQYSASNPPPYPVTKVNGKIGDVTLAASDVGADASGTANSAINSHNTSTSAHADIREQISQLSSEKVNKTSITLGIHTDGLVYVFVDGLPVGVGIDLIVAGDIIGYIDENNNVILSGNLTDGTYSIKYEMEDGSTVDIGNLVLDTNIYYSIVNTLTNCTNSNSASQVIEGESYSATITANDGYELKSVTVTMGDSPMSVSGGTINITSVTGNIVITAVAEEIQTGPTNLADPSSSDWLTDNRLSTSSGGGSSCTGHILTNYIPAKMGDVVRVKGLDITVYVNGKYGQVACYKSDKTYQHYATTGIGGTASGDAAKNSVTVNGDILTYTIAVLDSGAERATAETAFIRLDGALMDGYTKEDVIITINEEIV